MKTITGVIFKNCKKYKNKTAIKYKQGEVWKKISYDQLNSYTKNLANQISRKNVYKKGEKAIVLSKNCWQWIVADLGIMRAGLSTVPLHVTNSNKINNYIIKQSEAKILFLSGEEIKNIDNLIKDTQVKLIYCFDDNYDKKQKEKNFLNFNEIITKKNVKNSLKEDVKEEISTIFYTSGTTGMPKGVVLGHDNILANVKQATAHVPINKNDIFLSFLPYSHALERTSGYITPLICGAKIAIAESIEKLSENMKDIKPTVMIVVPRVLEKVYDKINDNVEAGSYIKKKIFNRAISKKHEGFQKKIYETIVFKKIKKSFGGNLRFLISGGSSLSKKIAFFFDKVGLTILEGYGLTEASPIIAVNKVSDNKLGTVGQLVPGTKMKLSKDGELLIKGPQIMKCYYRNEEKTKETFYEGSWLKTGDIVKVDENKAIKIVDRKKEIIVLSTGKNVSPQGVENSLNINKYISQSMVYGDNEKVLKAIIVPDFEELKMWLEKNMGTKHFNNNRIIKMQVVKNLYKKQIKKSLKDLGKHEQVGNFTLFPRLFSTEKNELTPTLKLKRRIILGEIKR